MKTLSSYLNSPGLQDYFDSSMRYTLHEMIFGHEMTLHGIDAIDMLITQST